MLCCVACRGNLLGNNFSSMTTSYWTSVSHLSLLPDSHQAYDHQCRPLWSWRQDCSCRKKSQHKSSPDQIQSLLHLNMSINIHISPGTDSAATFYHTGCLSVLETIQQYPNKKTIHYKSGLIYIKVKNLLPPLLRHHNDKLEHTQDITPKMMSSNTKDFQQEPAPPSLTTRL